jgi:DNA excision repair protein ERCC-2
MPPRFDDDQSRVELSVADLLEREAAGSLGFGQRGGYERMWLGQAIHSRYQAEAEAADPTYRREVALTAELVHRGWQIHLRGRADGLRRGEDGILVVEEIKSLRRGGRLAPATREMYQRQALLYAWMLRQEQDEEVRAELILIEIGSDVVEKEALEVSWPALDGEIRRRLSALLRAHQAERAAAAERRQAAEELAFPYSEVRPGQGEIIEAVELALDHQDHLLLQAPTGIGKTVAALYPALRFALCQEKRVFVLTAKTLQQDMAMQVLELLNDDSVFHSLRLRAKAKMCANGEVICHEEYCPYARDYYSKVKSSGVLARLLDDYATLEPEPIFARAKADEVCPFEISLDLSRQSQVVVCDYNYAFDPYVALSSFGQDEDLSDVILIVDEIHNLVERGRGYYSPSLSAAAAARLSETLLLSSSLPLLRRISGLAAELSQLIEEWVASALEMELMPSSGELAVETGLPEEEIWLLRPRFDEAFVDYLEYQRDTKSFRANDPWVDLYFSFLRFVNAMMLVHDEAFSTLALRDTEGAKLQILCKDPSQFLGRVIGRTHSTIGLSATLSPFDFYRDLLGFEGSRTATLAVPAPFPPENRCVVIDSTVETTYRQREAHYDRIASRLADFAASIPGNSLALFPSYAFLAQIADRLQVPGKRLLVQQRSDSDAAREEILAALRGSLFNDVLLLAVAGGVFAEGVDYPGDMLQGVAVVGPCLPAVTLERILLRDYFDQRFERGFEYAFVVPGMTRVVQAAGRLLRSPHDRGVIALFDRRFLGQPYRQYLPSEWLDNDDPHGLIDDPARAARRFFDPHRTEGQTLVARKP